MKFFVINDISLTGGTEKAVLELSKIHKAEIFDLEKNACNSRNFFSDFINFKNKFASLNAIEIHGFLEYSSFLVSIFCLLNNKKSIIWVRTSVKHKVGFKLGLFFCIALLFCKQVNFQNKCQEKEYLKKYKFLFFKKREIKRNHRIKNNKKINISSLKKGLMYAGRLEPSKGIIEICDFCIKNKINLNIYGYGSLENKIKVYSKNENIYFHGKYNNFYSLSSYSRLIINSDFEGNPNVLFEAISIGLPVYVKKWNECVRDYFNENDNFILYDNINEIDFKKLL